MRRPSRLEVALLQSMSRCPSGGAKPQVQTVLLGNRVNQAPLSAIGIPRVERYANGNAVASSMGRGWGRRGIWGGDGGGGRKKVATTSEHYLLLR